MALANYSEELIDENNTTASSGASSTNSGPLVIGKVGVALINGATAPTTPATVTVAVSADDVDYFEIVKDREGPSANNGEQHYEVDVSGWQYVTVDITATSQSVDKTVWISGVENT